MTPKTPIDQAFEDLAHITPTPTDTTEALAHTRTALNNHRPRKWLWATSIAAILILAALIALPLLTPQKASAQQMLATTLEANARYKGWVHMTIENRKRTDWDTVSGIVVQHGQNSDIHFDSPATRETFRFDAARQTIFIGSTESRASAAQLQAAESIPVTFAGLIKEVRGAIGQADVTVTHSTDRDMDRFDIDLPPSVRSRMVAPGANWFPVVLPSIVWVDSRTKLVSEMQSNGVKITFTYGAPVYGSIYDLGVPRDTRTVDLRLRPDVLAIYDRIKVRSLKDFPDGVLLHASHYARGVPVLLLYFRSGDQWAIRHYSMTPSGAPQPGKIPWPMGPADMPGIFEQLSKIYPNGESAGRGNTGRVRNFDLLTGAVSHLVTRRVDDRMVMQSEPGDIEFSPLQVRGAQDSLLRALAFYPTRSFEALASPVYRVELITSNDRPGLQAFRLERLRLPHVEEEWFDPAHQDRIMWGIQTVFFDDQLTQIYSQSTTEYKDFELLPDGRSYPTLITSSLKAPNTQGQLVELEFTPDPETQQPGKIMLRFFPKADLPPIPPPKKIPSP